MASTLPTGTISGLNYGHKLTNVFSGLLSSAEATAMYPQMIELISLDKKEELARLVEKILKIFSILMIPTTLACILFRKELVSAAFQRGAFNEGSTALTSGVFALYCICLFTAACNTVLSNIFYGHGDTKTPMFISLGNLGINIVLNLLLIQIWGVNGLALATPLSSISTFTIRLLAARKYVNLRWKTILGIAIKMLAASIVACLIPRVIFWLWPLNRYLVLIASAVISIAAYLVLVKLLRVREINDLVGLIRWRMKK